MDPANLSSAELYERIYRWKDYAREARELTALLLEHGIREGARVVEAGCGTGSFLEPLAANYEVEGFDRDAAMVDVARAKLPGRAIYRADMTGFELERPADALLCTFGSIGYVEPERLPLAAGCFLRALRPGGVALVEPWLSPEDARDGRSMVHVYDGTKADPPEELQLVRAALHRCEGRKSSLELHWLIVRPTGVEHRVEHHVLWQSTSEELLAAFRATGFEASWLEASEGRRSTLLLRRPERRAVAYHSPS